MEGRKTPSRPEGKKPKICWGKASKLRRPEIPGTRHPRFFCFHPGGSNFTVGSIIVTHPKM